ncbi:NAD(P)/FAD-dependent oxidoreductase [Lactiplantibacillus paraplantarum]|uniref:dihydrolipoyl dehydrogenase family protein n=1 Tax=Lactiplantibacillus paraplantarum TaxID=60520 RepID=UPI0021A81FD4|nr:NAD(P)/FAD-dependent oxidoreductase [Lactiplantibacillus paraplantarum]MCT4456976.1 NAD(P)/FAD-dependent oxidoreductase [Lactiplantibacillus paraplantarum]
MTEQYDVVVIGGGPAGTAMASGLKAHGKKVLIVEADLWGGTCPNRGCDPKKILLSAVEAQQSAQHLQGQGLTGTPKIDWPALMAHKRGYTDGINDGTLNGLKGQDIAKLHGQAHFQSDGQLAVGDQVVSATDYVIATGQRPAILPITGHEYFKTSTDFLDLDQMPKRVTFVGGGYVGFELATIANAAGADVHVIHHNDRPLKEFDADLVRDLMAAMTADGVTFDLNTDIHAITKTATGLQLTADDFELTTDLVISSAGRIPNADQLELANVGVTFDRHGIQVNDHLQTANPHIYAIGDVSDTPVPKLTPVAGFEARYLVGELTQADAAIKYPVIPTQVFAAPKLAQVGIGATVAAEQTDKYRVNTLDMTKWFTYYRFNAQQAQAKVVVEQASGQVVGATLLSDVADEMINYFTLLIEKHVTLAELQRLVLAYPTPASDLQYLY